MGEVEYAFGCHIHSLLAHEMPGLDQEARGGVEFATFFECDHESTPPGLLRAGIYDQVGSGAVWCGVVRCGAVRCGAARPGAVRCGAVRRGVVWGWVVWVGRVGWSGWGGAPPYCCTQRTKRARGLPLVSGCCSIWQVAVPLKGGALRPASMALLAIALSGRPQTAKPGQPLQATLPPRLMPSIRSPSPKKGVEDGGSGAAVQPLGQSQQQRQSCEKWSRVRQCVPLTRAIKGRVGPTLRDPGMSPRAELAQGTAIVQSDAGADTAPAATDELWCLGFGIF